jgi:DMSO/TMAO reductase YedYZ molybdopterin-dependent catalytic subunit
VDDRNAETPLEELAGTAVAPESFYVRSHFPTPTISHDTWRLRVDGAARRPLSLSLEDLRKHSSRTIPVTLECAGNGRRRMNPVPKGTAWDLGAVSTATFTGTSLAGILEDVVPDPEAVEVSFVGADRETGESDAFERSLPIDVARHEDTLVVWAMNDRPLAPEHGFPVRLIVPGWYGMASVKWLERIHVRAEPFAGYFQATKYVYDDGEGPVSRMRVRALFAGPGDGSRVSSGNVRVHGSAWSGHGDIVRVAVSADGGVTWRDAMLGRREGPYAATPWFAHVSLAAGTHELCARATDAAGHEQPMEPISNRLGYGNNVVHRIRVTAHSS